LAAGAEFRRAFNALENASAQLEALEAFFDRLAGMPGMAASEREELAA
jgi:hypothetical protein